MLTTSLHAFPNRNCYSVVGSSIGKLPAAPDVYEWLRSRDLAKGRRKERKIPIVVVLSPFLADGFMDSLSFVFPRFSCAFNV